MSRTKLWYLERFGLIDSLSPAQRSAFERQTRMLHVKRGQTLYLAGASSDDIFLLKTGAVRIEGRAADGGADVVLAMLAPGDVFGELAIVDNSPRDHRAVAATESVVCAVPREVLTRLISESPRLGLQVTKLMGMRLHTFKSRVEELLCKSAPARLAHVLLELANRYGVRDAAGVLIPLRLSQNDLGRLAGLSRETVNGILQDWKQQRLVEADRRSIRISKPESLADVH